MGKTSRDQGALSGHKGKGLTIDSEVNGAAQDNRELLLWMLMHWEDRTGLIDIPHQRLVDPVHGLAGDPRKRRFSGNLVPVDRAHALLTGGT